MIFGRILTIFDFRGDVGKTMNFLFLWHNFDCNVRKSIRNHPQFHHKWVVKAISNVGNVGKTLNHPPVISIFIGDSIKLTIPSHGCLVKMAWCFIPVIFAEVESRKSKVRRHGPPLADVEVSWFPEPWGPEMDGLW